MIISPCHEFKKYVNISKLDEKNHPDLVMQQLLSIHFLFSALLLFCTCTQSPKMCTYFGSCVLVLYLCSCDLLL